jgi:hypothetical protein
VFIDEQQLAVTEKRMRRRGYPKARKWPWPSICCVPMI